MISEKEIEKALEIIGQRVVNQESLQGKETCSDNDCMTLYSLAYSLYNMGDLPQAEQLFRKLIQTKPYDAKHWMGLGAALQMQHLYKEALTSWSMSALLLPNDPQPHYYAAECLISLNEPKEAVKALRMAQERYQAATESLKTKINSLLHIWGGKHD
ncbi:MAG: SycD/LcrH family type III secretion system chaperone [Chlamydiales bacterium]|nr:SycD/LcrH family type III secretion system chaperone [Chlamydiales bacterium]